MMRLVIASILWYCPPVVQRLVRRLGGPLVYRRAGVSRLWWG